MDLYEKSADAKVSRSRLAATLEKFDLAKMITYGALYFQRYGSKLVVTER